MKGCNTWSYAPYQPLLRSIGDIYVCRVAPSAHSIHLEWLYDEGEDFAIYCRKRDDTDFSLCGTTREKSFDIVGLESENDYEFYVTCGDAKSRVRLARCAETVGTVVNYLHPDDNCYAFSGRALCSPSLVRHPDGHLLASMDVF